MKYCPITYAEIAEQQDYSTVGLKLLAPALKNLAPLNLSSAEQRAEAIALAGKMSIQGVQAKLSARLKIQAGFFEIVSEHGQFILKPQSEYYPELPQNEALTMTLAATIGIETPTHGLVYAKDQSMTYFIKRFDRAAHGDKLSTEDFAQLAGGTRETKYNSSMEKVAQIINKFCTFPRVEAVKLFKLTLFNFLIGNEDMHLKNFSLITKEKKIMLSPAYDLLNTTISQANTVEEIALPLNGKKNNLTKKDFFEYLPERLQINNTVTQRMQKLIITNIPLWEKLIARSFLTKNMQEKYITLLNQRLKILQLI
jgi:serine/threonine-protein kinase HipA